MPGVPPAIQNVIDDIDAQIQKDRSPVMNVILALPVFVIVSLPIAFLVGAVTLIVLGTNAPMVSQTEGRAVFGIVTGVLTVLIFCAWAAYGTYSTSQGTHR